MRAVLWTIIAIQALRYLFTVFAKARKVRNEKCVSISMPEMDPPCSMWSRLKRLAFIRMDVNLLGFKAARWTIYAILLCIVAGGLWWVPVAVSWLLVVIAVYVVYLIALRGAAWLVRCYLE